MAAPYNVNVSPVFGSIIEVSDSVTFDVFCNVAMAQIVVAFAFDSMQTVELAWIGAVSGGGAVSGSFLGAYASSCNAVAATDGGNNGVSFSFIRSPVWPVSLTAIVRAVSVGGDVFSTTFSWSIDSAALIPSVPPAVVPNYPVGPGPGPNDSNAVVHDAAYYLALFDRIFPELSYLAPIKETANGGYELYQADAAIGARLSLAVQRFENGGLIIYAPEGSKATGYVTFYRASAAAGAFTILTGTVVRTSSGGRDFVTTQDGAFGALDLEITVPIAAVATGYQWNVPGERITLRGEVAPGDIDTIVAIYTLPAYADPSVQVKQVLDTTGGVAQFLEGLGNDRGMPRAPFETADAYRLRIRSLVDTVSPGAIIRATHRILDPVGIGFDFIETGDIRYQTCWDAPSPDIGTPSYQSPMPLNPRYDPNLFVFDDPRSEYPFRNMWLDEIEMRGAFIILVKPTSFVLDTGMAYDDVGTGPGSFIKPNGTRRGTSAWDLPFPADTTVIAYGAFDGSDRGAASAYLALWQTLQKLKAAGVAAIIELWHPT